MNENSTRKNHRFRLILSTNGTTDEANRRLRAALKCLLRSYRLRCEYVVDEKNDAEGMPASTPSGPDKKPGGVQTNQEA